MKQKILVTCGLPYANGNAHLGHIVEYLMGDVYSRSLKLMGEDAVFLCASDTHGAPIEVKARFENKTPEEFVAFYSAAQQKDFKDFGIVFDYFYTTHSEENRKHAEFIFEELKKKGQISVRPVEQYFCETDKRFLPDRFIKGICPFCKAQDQYGDVCEACGKTYSPTDLLEPHCAICKNTPIRKKSDHYFFKLSEYTETLKTWLTEGDHVQPEIRNFVLNWVTEGLRDWDISRDGPYFGFKIPGETDKYFYVWLDAPIGYIATTDKFCQEKGLDFDSYWKGNARIEHIIGKDIVYFHTLFWPAMLAGSGYTLPSRVHVHGMLKVNGEKMSKARGNFVNARRYLDHLDPQYLRYYFAAHMTPQVEDIDLNFTHFIDRVNGELVNNVVNLASRSLQFAHNVLGGTLGTMLEEDKPMLTKFEAKVSDVLAFYKNRDFANAIRVALEISKEGNVYQQEKAPWQVAKTDPEKARSIVTAVANIVKLVAILLKPILPKYAKDIETILGIPETTFEDASKRIENQKLNPFIRLLERADIKVEKHIIDTVPAKEEPKKETKKEPKKEEKVEPKAEIQYDDFAKVDFRVGHILQAEIVPKADKLLKLSIDLGEETPRTIVSGIAKAYKPEELLNKKVAVVANLAKKPLRGIESHGMILAAGEPPTVLFLPDSLTPGTLIK